MDNNKIADINPAWATPSTDTSAQQTGSSFTFTTPPFSAPPIPGAPNLLGNLINTLTNSANSPNQSAQAKQTGPNSFYHNKTVETACHYMVVGRTDDETNITEFIFASSRAAARNTFQMHHRERFTAIFIIREEKDDGG